MNLTFPFAVNVMLKLSNSIREKGPGRGGKGDRVSFSFGLAPPTSAAASPQMLSLLSCNKTARCKLAGENCGGKAQG